MHFGKFNKPLNWPISAVARRVRAKHTHADPTHIHLWTKKKKRHTIHGGVATTATAVDHDHDGGPCNGPEEKSSCECTLHSEQMHILRGGFRQREIVRQIIQCAIILKNFLFFLSTAPSPTAPAAEAAPAILYSFSFISRKTRFVLSLNENVYVNGIRHHVNCERATMFGYRHSQTHTSCRTACSMWRILALNRTL